MNANAGSVDTDDWNRHWSSYAASNALNPAQAYRRMLIFRALSLTKTEASHARLLELGCGQGEFSVELSSRYPGLELVGLDLSQTGVSIAHSRVPTGAFFQQDLLQPIALPEQY